MMSWILASRTTRVRKKGWYKHARNRAHSLTHKAIREGKLPNLKVRRIRCKDCPARATCYDHRDYAKPLKVSAVCTGCNIRRGRAIVSKWIPRRMTPLEILRALDKSYGPLSGKEKCLLEQLERARANRHSVKIPKDSE